MQYPEPDDGAWPARVLRNRRLNQIPETENPATPLRFMHQRRTATPTTKNVALEMRHSIACEMERPAKINGSAAKKRQPTLEKMMSRIKRATPGSKDPSRLASTTKMLMKPANVMEISAVVSKKEKMSNSAA